MCAGIQYLTQSESDLLKLVTFDTHLIVAHLPSQNSMYHFSIHSRSFYEYFLYHEPYPLVYEKNNTWSLVC